MKVDADYSGKPYEEWKADDWPLTYMAQGYDNIWAAGIAFAPPHQISRPRRSPRHRHHPLAAPDRHAVRRAGKVAAESIAARIKQGPSARPVEASMARMGAACVASAGTGLRKGSAASMTMMPIVPDFDRFPPDATSPTRVARSASRVTGPSSCCTTSSSIRPRPASAGSSSRSDPMTTTPARAPEPVTPTADLTKAPLPRCGPFAPGAACRCRQAVSPSSTRA